MNAFRVLCLGSGGLLVALAAASPATAETCSTRRTAITITLDDDQSTQASGEQLGQFNCWMPKPAAATKDLCQDDVSLPHQFSITLANQCTVPVRVRLRLQGGGSLRFQEPRCGNGAVLFDDVITPGTPVPVTCTSAVETLGSGSKATRYNVVATHVQLATGPPQPLSPPVEYDPEIAVKDPSGLNVHKGLWALAIIGGALLIWFIARRFRTSTR